MSGGARGLSDEELEEFRELFRYVDRDGGGSIELNELKQMLSTIGVGASHEEACLVFREMDPNGDGSISYEEFVEFMSRGVIRCFPAEKLIEAFETLRTPNDRPGTISRRELSRTLMALLPEAVPNEEAAEKLVAHIPVDNRGAIDFRQYVLESVDNSAPAPQPSDP